MPPVGNHDVGPRGETGEGFLHKQLHSLAGRRGFLELHDLKEQPRHFLQPVFLKEFKQ